ncbi:PIR protein [Plasmodium ovale]|uniref:PIR protein n=1 Tax=Plasmodium ovale TaxID=36330 RepID=A0A1D3JGD6_PLAOA|nr:PIR protein [Plasmodium ovale]
MGTELAGFEDEEEEEEDYIEGDDYYPYISLFHEHKDEFANITSDVTYIQKYEKYCKHINKTYFSDEDFGNRCYKVAKYLDHVKQKGIEDKYVPCKYLNYLLNTDEQFSKFSKYYKTKLIEAYKYLSTELNTCVSNIEHIKSDEILGKLIILYNLNELLNSVEQSMKSSDINTCTRAMEFATLYEGNKNNCLDSTNHVFCDELDKIEQSCYQRIKDINCPEVVKKLEFLIQHNRTVAILVPCMMTIGIFFFSFILYKFTPFGYYVNKHIMIKKSIHENKVQEETNLQNFKHETLDLQNRQFNVKYNTMENY